MKKFTFLMIALFIAAMGFAQANFGTAARKMVDNQKVAVQNMKSIKGSSAQTRTTRALECSDDALFSTVDLASCQSAGTSNTSAGYLQAMRVDGFTLPLSSIRFFGAQMLYSGGWTEVADVESLNFNIKIYADDNNMPGTVVETYSNVSLTHTATTDLLFDLYSVFQFDYTFETPVDVPATFWIEISNTEDNVWFMWLDNESGGFTSAAYDTEEGTWEVSADVAYQICLIPEAPTASTIVAMPLSLSFNGVLGSEIAAKTVSVSSFNLTEAITVTTAAPFSVSSDGSTFAETASIAAEGGVLYVKYTPTAEGTQNGTVVLASTGAENVTISLTGSAIDCSTPITDLPFEETFDNTLSGCWSIISNNTENAGDLGIVDGEFQFSSYSTATDYNQYLITPQLGYTEDVTLSFDYAVASSYGTEKFAVLASTTTNDIAAFTTNLSGEIEATNVSTAGYETYHVTVPAGTKYIAIKYYSEYQYYLYVDNFTFSAVPTSAEIALTSVTPANGAFIPSGQNITLSGVVTNNGTALTSYKVAYTVDGGEAVEYTVSEINVANAATHNFTHATPISGLAIGSHTIVVTVSEPNGTADGDASDNSMTVNITVTAPLAYGCYFETDPAEEGWSFVDSDNDGNNWTWENSASTPHMTTYEGIGCIYSESYNSAALTPDNWAISPAIVIENGPITVSLYAKGQDPDYAAEHFQIYAGTSADVTAMTSVSEEFVATGEYTQYTANLPESYVGQTIYVAIRHFNVSDEFVLVVDNFEVLAYGHVVITDIEENIAESIAVYPNPTSSMVTIANAEGKDIIVVNSLGQVVASIENAAANQTIDVTNFANGTYFVKVDGEVVKLNVVK